MIEGDDDGRGKRAEMLKFLCRLVGHDLMTTSARHRVCLRCGQRETLRDCGHVLAWEELPAAAARGSRG